MPVFLTALGGLLLNIVGSLVGRVLVALGIAVVTYTGISASTDYLRSLAISNFSAMGADVIGMLGVMKVGESFSMVTSAIATRLLVQGLTSDKFKRFVHK